MNRLTFTNKMLNIFLYFLTYSFCGWIIETIYMSIYHGHFTKRGFLIGPICIVYGIGTISVVFIFYYLKTHPLILFLCSSFLTTIVEFISGIVLKKLINHRLWDYSDNFANLMGYICLRNTIIWGILSLLLVYRIHPIVIKSITSIPIKKKHLMCFIVLILLFLDITISIYAGLNGKDSFVWVSQIVLRKIEDIENVSSRVVYFISH